jgi:hypothetical protein
MGRNQLRKAAGVRRIFHLAFSVDQTMSGAKRPPGRSCSGETERGTAGTSAAAQRL